MYTQLIRRKYQAGHLQSSVDLILKNKVSCIILVQLLNSMKSYNVIDYEYYWTRPSYTHAATVYVHVRNCIQYLLDKKQPRLHQL